MRTCGLAFPFGNAITGAKASLALLHVITSTRDFLTQISTTPNPGMLLWHAPYWQINNTSASLLCIYILYEPLEKRQLLFECVCGRVVYNILCVRKDLIPCKTVYRKWGSRLAQTGSWATLGLAASSGKCVPILPHTAASHGGLKTSTPRSN